MIRMKSVVKLHGSVRIQILGFIITTSVSRKQTEMAYDLLNLEAMASFETMTTA